MRSEALPVRKFECLICKHSDYRMSAREVGELVSGECPRCGGEMKVLEESPKWLAEPLGLVSRHFDITDFVAWKDRIELEVAARDTKRSFRSLLSALKRRGYLPVMREHKGELRISVVRYPRVKAGNIAINLLLFVATCMTTFAAGYFLLFGQNPLHAAMFSSSIMFMWGTHEMGHKIAAWRNGVEASPPYFIPAPTQLGTFGAVISIKSPIPTKEALIEMGAAGPLMGFAVAFPLTTIGLLLSKPDPTGIALPLTPAIFALLQVATLGHVPPTIWLHPLALAGWVVMVITMFNLIPAGQLDGGHVARGLMNRERHYTLTRVLGFSLFLLGVLSLPLLLWGFFIIILFRGYHMGALDDVSELSKHHRILAVAVLVLFLLCLPVPVG